MRLLSNKKYNIIKEENKIIIIFLIKNLITEKDEEMKLLNSINLELNSYINLIKDLQKENKALKEEILKLKDISL